MLNLLLPAALLTSISLCTGATITSTITQSSSPSPTSTPESFSNTQTFQSDILTAHNFYRSEHNASALTWNTTSASYASNYASNCNFKHSGGPTGENLAAGYANASASIDAWGLERENYNFKKPGFSEETGHFTQLVWSNTTSVGCGRVNCEGKNGTPGWYVVCEYWPAGNVLGGEGGVEFFKDNVRALSKGNLKDTVETGVTSNGMGMSGGGRRVWWGLFGVGVLGLLL